MSIWGDLRSRVAIRKRQLESTERLAREGVREYVRKRKRSATASVTDQK